ncbi:MAG: PEFG-CTERM sorting domain-containing protein [Nitrosopumilus sp.]|nr:MAG: PEFG-CTERM sorting domain-containing protein [Nitrosopumilus sp.]
MNHYLILGLILLASVILPTNVYAEHILDVEAFAQISDLIESTSQKFTLEVDGETFLIPYGYGGSMDSFNEEYPQPKVVSMNINKENKSLEIVLESVPERYTFWVILPEEIISHETEDYGLFVDGEERGYELAKSYHGFTLGFIVPEGATQVEITGTRVIPEFGAYATLIFAISVIGLVLFARKFSFANGLPRIN